MADPLTQDSIVRIPSQAPAALTTARPPDRKATARRAMSIARRWYRDTFSKEQLVSSLKSLVWVAPLTVLIWVYAEREQVDDATAQFVIEVRSGAPGQVAHLQDARSATVMAKVSGPKARVGQAVESLQAGAPVQLIIGGGRHDGLHDIDPIPLIHRDPRLRDNGLSVVSCEPKMIRVKIDTLREELLDVKLPLEVSRLLSAPPLFDPPKVRVSAPSSAFEQAPKGSLYVEAELPPEMRTPGRHGPTSVRITAPSLGSADVALRQSSVMATVDVRDADERLELKSVPVKMLVTQEINEGYTVSYQPKFVLSVPVYGAPDRIRQLQNGEIPRPEAMFGVNSGDISARKGTRKLDFLLPDGITMRDEDKPSVLFEITPKDATQ